jgi:3'-phosphoadenosine 5'-phosphosulfate sulfotransferase (PAPS reductase)/FAD synthetase
MRVERIGEAAMDSPYRIHGPALISFSGGRTSAFMLYEILRAYDGQLPDDVRVVFANTGKEREETLRFVHDCATHWGVAVRWVEWHPDGFREVGYNSASRNGEPFAGLIGKRRFLPNAVTRFCTQELKIRVMRDFARSLGWERWTNVIGLRYDEGHRVLKALANNDTGRERWRNAMPLSKARATKADVSAFWSAQPFDLALRPYEGNCDLCFLKARGKLTAIIRENPGVAGWWVDLEASVAGRFVTEYSYSDLAREVHTQGHLFDGFLDDEHDAECGLLCAPEPKPEPLSLLGAAE